MRPGSHLRRLPYAPLERVAVGREITDAGLAAMIGVHRSAVYRWRSEGLTVKAADGAAVALGLHPLEVWPEFYTDDDLEAAS